MSLKRPDQQPAVESKGSLQAILRRRGLLSVLLVAGAVSVAGVALNRPSNEKEAQKSLKSEMEWVKNDPEDPIVMAPVERGQRLWQSGQKLALKAVEKEIDEEPKDIQSRVARSFLEIPYEEVDQAMVDLGFYDIDAFPEFMLAFAKLQDSIREGNEDLVRERARQLLETSEELNTDEAIDAFRQIKKSLKGSPDKINQLQRAQGYFKSILNHAELLKIVGEGG